MNISANSPIAAAREITIGADIQAVWDALTQIDRWPEWNTDIPNAHLAGPLAVNTVFHWETAWLAIASTIGELPGPIEAVQAALDASLVRWLAALKIRAEPVAR